MASKRPRKILHNIHNLKTKSCRYIYVHEKSTFPLHYKSDHLCILPVISVVFLKANLHVILILIDFYALLIAKNRMPWCKHTLSPTTKWSTLKK